jgi:hypothetical protein
MGRSRSVRPRAQSIPRDKNDDVAHVLEWARRGLAERHVPIESDKRVLRGDVIDIATAKLEFIHLLGDPCLACILWSCLGLNSSHVFNRAALVPYRLSDANRHSPVYGAILRHRY